MGLLSKFKKQKSNINLSVNFTETDMYGNTSPVTPSVVSGSDEIGNLAIWAMEHPELKMKDDEFYEYVNNYNQFQSNDAPVDLQLENLSELVAFLNEYRAYCYNQPDERYKRYFETSYEHCHNSKSDDFRLIDSYQEKLQELKNNYNALKLRERLIQTLPDELYQFIKNNNGILQKDIYKSFESVLKNDIQHLIYQWAKDGKVVRVKQGNTYTITIK